MGSVCREDLLQEIKRLTVTLGHSPKVEEFDRYGEFKATEYVDEFGSLTKARKEASIDEPTVPIPNAPIEGDPGDPTQLPSHDDLLNDLYLVSNTIGKPPNSQDIIDYGVYDVDDFIVQFGSINAAMERMEEGLVGEIYRLEDLTAHLREIGNKIGRAPIATDVLRLGYVSMRKYGAYFETWPDALRSAGFEVSEHGHATKTELLEAVSDLWGQIDRPPLPEETAEHTAYSKIEYIRRFGNWGGLLNAVDRESDIQRNTLEEPAHLYLALDLLRVSQATENPLTIETFCEYGQFTLEVYIETFSTWEEALRAAGIEPPVEIIEKSHPSNKEVEQALAEIASNNDRPLSLRTVVESEKIDPQAVFDYYSSWKMVLDVAGLSGTIPKRSVQYQFPFDAADLVFEDKLRTDNLFEIEELLLSDLWRVIDESGYPPRPLEVELFGAFPVSQYQSEFGGWEQILQEVPVSSAQTMSPLLNRKQILSSLLWTLETVAIDKSAVPEYSDIDTWTTHTSTSFVSALGSYEAAVDHSGVRRDDPNGYARDVIAAELYRVAREFECRPSKEVLLELLPYSKHAFESAFKNMRLAWREAKNSGPSTLFRTEGSADSDSYQRELLSDAENVLAQSGSLQLSDIAEYSRFSPETYLSFFGSWDAFVRAIDGYEPKSLIEQPESERQSPQDVSEAYTNPDRREILTDLWKTASQSKGKIRLSRRLYQKEGSISPEKIEEIFGSFSAAMQIAGLEPKTNSDVILTWYPPLDLDLVTELERIQHRVDRRPTKNDVNSYGMTSVATYIQRFGSWENTMKILSSSENIPNRLIISSAISSTSKTGRTKKYSEDELLDVIEELAKEIEATPTSTKMSEAGTVNYNTILSHFGSWEAALTAADIPYTSAGIERSQSISTIADEVDGLGKTGVMRLGEDGYATVGDVYEASEEDLMEVDGIGPNVATRLKSYLER